MLVRVPFPSPNFSVRNSAVSTVVLHTAEGASSIEGLGAFFSRPSSGVSSHVGIDDSPGRVGEYVRRGFKAWTASAANPWSVQAELCGFARWSRDEWMTHPAMLANTAAWIGEECAVFGIPIVGLDPAGAQAPGVKGVCQHADLGRMGGGHWDCGPGFPFEYVLEMARPKLSVPVPEDDDVTNWTICAAPGDVKQYVTDMVTVKRHLRSEADVNTTVWCLTASGAKVYHQTVADPIRVPKETLDAIPDA